MLNAFVPISILPVIDAQQREIDHWLSRIRRLEAAMDRMVAGRRLERAEKALGQMLDHIDALNDEMMRMDLTW